MTNLSLFWARVMGLFATILALWCFFNLDTLYPLLIDLSNNQLMLMNFGTFTLLIGLTVVVSHPIFRGWPILVTLMGFLTILKGLLFLFFPHALSNILVVWQDKNMMMAPLPALILGLALIYFGFVRKH